MRGIEFVNDLCCNYLTIPYESTEDDFALRMMTENEAEAFLPMELRRMDEEIFLYYNISGKQNMEIFYAEKPIERKAFQKFMWQLREAIEQSRELFLPWDGICLEPSTLFFDLGKGQWEFLYIPGQDKREMEEVQSEREKLAEFLVMHMDYDDKDLTEAVYRFYEEICAGKIYPDFWGDKMASEKTWEMEQEERAEKAEMEKEDHVEDWEFEEPEAREPEREIKVENICRKRKLQAILCILLCVAVTVTLVAGRIVPDMIVAGGAATALLVTALLATIIKSKNSDEDAGHDSENVIFVGSEEKLYNEEKYEEEEYTTEEKTVYMDINREQEKKLYGLGKFRRQKIFLDKLPCLVGKDKTLVNHIIADSSVSRMHAKIFAEEEMIWVQDLNSTNGTYHNGMRLNPNEKVILEPEDEIGFGQVQFVFR